MFNKLFIAEKLGKFLYEVNSMPYSEYKLWLAYFEYKADEEKKRIDSRKRR